MADTRIELKFQVTETGRSSSGRRETWLHGSGSDLSSHGLFIQSSQIFPPGTRMSIVLLPVGGRALLVQAHVSWARATGTSGMGVVFDDVSSTVENALDQIGHGLRSRRIQTR